jgi:hypothetical protein
LKKRKEKRREELENEEEEMDEMKTWMVSVIVKSL